MLTVKKLKAMNSFTIFAKGEGLIEHPWFNDAKGNLEPDGRSVKVHWVAIRGGWHDWAIYHSLDANLEHGRYLDGTDHLKATWQQIADHGAKLRDRDKIRELVPCSDEALEMYRD